MNIDNNFLNFISRQRGPLAVAATTLLVIVISICSLKFGSFIVFQNLYYFPIIISCVYYLRRGFAFSVLLAFLYFFLTIAFTRDAIILQQAVIRVLIFILVAGVITFLSLRRKQAEEEREKLIHELQDALGKIKTLSGLLPICASCKKIRDDKGYWNQIEAYIGDHSEAEFTHKYLS